MKITKIPGHEPVHIYSIIHKDIDIPGEDSIRIDEAETGGSGPSGPAILGEDGTYVLQEDGTYILLET